VQIIAPRLGDVGNELGIPASTLSHHLEKLKNENLVKVRREGTYLWYSANTEAYPTIAGTNYAAFYLNGAQAADPAGVPFLYSFTSEFVSEFKVMPNSSSARYVGDAVVQVVTKSGTSAFHGAGNPPSEPTRMDLRANWSVSKPNSGPPFTEMSARPNRFTAIP